MCRKLNEAWRAEACGLQVDNYQGVHLQASRSCSSAASMTCGVEALHQHTSTGRIPMD